MNVSGLTGINDTLINAFQAQVSAHPASLALDKNPSDLGQSFFATLDKVCWKLGAGNNPNWSHSLRIISTASYVFVSQPTEMFLVFLLLQSERFRWRNKALRHQINVCITSSSRPSQEQRPIILPTQNKAAHLANWHETCCKGFTTHVLSHVRESVLHLSHSVMILVIHIKHYTHTPSYADLSRLSTDPPETTFIASRDTENADRKKWVAVLFTWRLRWESYKVGNASLNR